MDNIVAELTCLWNEKEEENEEEGNWETRQCLGKRGKRKGSKSWHWGIQGQPLGRRQSLLGSRMFVITPGYWCFCATGVHWGEEKRAIFCLQLEETMQVKGRSWGHLTPGHPNVKEVAVTSPELTGGCMMTGLNTTWEMKGLVCWVFLNEYVWILQRIYEQNSEGSWT